MDDAARTTMTAMAAAVAADDDDHTVAVREGNATTRDVILSGYFSSYTS